jgi:hypothetical protein
MNVFPGQGARTKPLELPLEAVKLGVAKPPAYRPLEAGSSADIELIETTLSTWEHAVVEGQKRQPQPVGR